MNESLLSKDVVENRLLVEGPEDLHVCYHLLNHHGLADQVKILDKQGIENLLRSLRVELLGSGKRHLGVVVDADHDLNARWQSLQDTLINAGYKTVPTSPDPDGTVIQEDKQPTVGIWLMPNNQVPGMLENFLSFLVPPQDPLWTTAEEILEQVIKLDCRFPEVHKIKAHIHTWLAWQKEPGKPLGQAITKHYLDPYAPSAQHFTRWIRQVFAFDSA
jgi:hypothetical protein